jgi:Tfp pilus assembly protein FimV
LVDRQKVFQEIRQEEGIMTLDIKHWILSHLVWVVGVAVALYGFHTWSAEHDARLKAEATIKQDESQVATLQQAITQNNQTVAQLQQQMAARDAQNANIIASLVKAKAQAVTPPQQVTVLQTEAKLPEPIVSIPNTSDWRLPSADVAPLFEAVTDGAAATANLQTCTDDLTDEKNIVATDTKTIGDQTQQIGLKDNEIAALKAKPKFWHRVGSDLKKVGIGVGIGMLIVLVH